MWHNLVLDVIYCKGWWCTTQIWPVIYVKIEGFQFSSHWYPSQSAQKMHKKGTQKRILDQGNLSMCMDFSITSSKRVKSDSPLPWFNLNILTSRMDSFLSVHLPAQEDPPGYLVISYKWRQQAAISPSKQNSQHGSACSACGVSATRRTLGLQDLLQQLPPGCPVEYNKSCHQQALTLFDFKGEVPGIGQYPWRARGGNWLNGP